MKAIIASDLHGSAYYTQKLIDQIELLKPDKLILLGDILYHGPRNDLPRDYNPKLVAELLNEHKEYIISFHGNCDAEVDQMVLDFDITRSTICIPLKDFNLYLTHGHKNNPDNPLKVTKNSIVLFGHTHVPFDKYVGGTRYINPGSISIPKENSAHSFIFFDGADFIYMSLD